MTRSLTPVSPLYDVFKRDKEWDEKWHKLHEEVKSWANLRSAQTALSSASQIEPTSLFRP